MLRLWEARIDNGDEPYVAAQPVAEGKNRFPDGALFSQLFESQIWIGSTSEHS